MESITTKRARTEVEEEEPNKRSVQTGIESYAHETKSKIRSHYDRVAGGNAASKVGEARFSLKNLEESLRVLKSESDTERGVRVYYECERGLYSIIRPVSEESLRKLETKSKEVAEAETYYNQCMDEYAAAYDREKAILGLVDALVLDDSLLRRREAFVIIQGSLPGLFRENKNPSMEDTERLLSLRETFASMDKKHWTFIDEAYQASLIEKA